jgi:hypothetical protein
MIGHSASACVCIYDVYVLYEETQSDQDGNGEPNNLLFHTGIVRMLKGVSHVSKMITIHALACLDNDVHLN